MSKQNSSRGQESARPAGPKPSLQTRFDLGRVFSAMADPTRRAILARLVEGPATVSQLAEPFDMSLPAVSKHLKVLERAGLLGREIVGRVHHCHAVIEPLKEAEAWIAQREAFWEQGLDSLRSFLAEPAVVPQPDGASTTPAKLQEGSAAGTTTDRALAIVCRAPDGEWRIERLLEDVGPQPAAHDDKQTRR